MHRLYSTQHGFIVHSGGRFVRLPDSFDLDALFASPEPHALLAEALRSAQPASEPALEALRPPLQSQEIWAAGVTYLRSMTARMEEAKNAGGGTFYDRVYAAERPELFFKATPHRTVGSGGKVRIRSDSKWNVPEPELTLAISARGRIFGYTAGNDMSSRDIEGENPLYLPQAKVYLGSAAIGPCLVVSPELPSPDTAILLEIRRGGVPVFSGETTIGRIMRPLPSLADWLFREQSFPHGCYLMTGTGIVPPDSFTLRSGDEVRIAIPPVGTLFNTIA
ncbi:fumarylacetoacetate hydrolase family protein [Opitutus terrae]|uniref:Fumarylacetoacetase family protein n=1 Tax=Opitutus terrae (strain DSM 11246 / JCM 15787 / PB90-1) TaxID=452637 RepID=B1ZUY2_OPITP|nr:fumarylacetoacetate hydrolase family protein [Opitutus terrae]ACB75952.1 fumarylacetoacetase family protein [Opitutus terrae PB90-1]